MEKDFHFYCTAVLAKAAGFNAQDALTLAYASQYVDDAAENKPLRVGEISFDPVRTAHDGLESFHPEVQRRVFLPFHFLPSRPLNSEKDNFATAPDSFFARWLIAEAAAEKNPHLQLYRLGTALHTYADTWAHQGFSGRDHKENDIEGIEIKKGFLWKSPLFKKIMLALLPHIGHAEASAFPDKPYLRWKYKRKISGREVELDNSKEFLKAAKAIYDFLLKVFKRYPEKTVPFRKIKETLQELFSYEKEDMELRCDQWKDSFSDWFYPHEFHYDRHAWRQEALGTEELCETQWDDFEPSDFSKLHFKMTAGFNYSHWVQFHQASALQRNLVVSNVSFCYPGA